MRLFSHVRVCALQGMILLILISAVTTSHSENSCQGKMINPFNDVCWSCFFPITIGTFNVPNNESALPDTPNSANPFCLCEWDPFPEVGVTMAYWEPMAIVEVTKTPYCAVNVGGKILMHDGANHEGALDTSSPTENSGFYYTHYYNFPIMSVVATTLLGGSCKTDGAMLFPTYFSELDPTTHDEALAALMFPESQLINANTARASEAACGIDSVVANTGLPRDEPFYCAGSQGFVYPLTGTVDEQVSSVQAVTLMAERSVFKLHRVHAISDTSPADSCNEYQTLRLQKSHYRYQMSYPSQGPCEPFGRSTLLWEAGKMKPFSQPNQTTDAAFIIWRKRNCCTY